MKAALVILSVLVAALSLYGFVQHLNAQGAVNVLDAVHHGATKGQVRAVMQTEPIVIPAHEAPEWLRAGAPAKEEGKYWYFYMGIPPRNLIVYFDESGTVVFPTWAPT